MSQNIPTHYAQQYASNIELLLQQKGSKLRDAVTPMSVTGAKSAVPVDQIGKVEATKRTTRYPQLTPADTPTDRPWVYPSDYDWNDLIDSIDKLRVVTDPQSAYVTNGTYAMGRSQDKEILAAMFGDRKTGESGATTTSFLAGNVVAVNTGASGAVGLTVAKLRAAKKLLLAAEVDLEMDPITVPISAVQHDNLLSEIQVTSLDFNERPVLVEGNVTRFLGMNFKHSEMMSADASGYREVPVFAKSGVTLAIWNEITTDISVRKDLAGLPVQVYVFGTYGATRTQEKKVVKILCSEV